MRHRHRWGRTFASDCRGTPADLYRALAAEFGPFTLDPCPLDTSATAGAPLWGKDGLRLDWTGHRVYCNPPYSDCEPWLLKAPEAELAVYLLPAKTDTRWWHASVLQAVEIRFVRGRVRFTGSTFGAPFASVIAVYRAGATGPPVLRSIDRLGRPLP